MNFSYSKSERLKSKKTIDLLFSSGKSVSKFPLRLVYVALDETQSTGTTVGVSVSKKHFKHAVDRNYYKRILRETYRLNKHLLLDSLEKPHAFMLFYQSAERLPYAEIHQKTIQLFEKFALQVQSKPNQ